ncbi:hypothetical protein [Halococcus sediminicola]|uniref:hypothetical protein n=1 Tax=Halococcus sediminicola TaxID=1264579 RepID=UPI0006794536|nr:hypothetical protein [Halococcus sediminicola]
MNLLFRVLVGAFVCVAPSLLFLGLWHGLQRMQDGEFVERVAGHHGTTVEDLLPTTRRSHELDSAERRRLQRMAVEGDAALGFDDSFAPDDEPPG